MSAIDTRRAAAAGWAPMEVPAVFRAPAAVRHIKEAAAFQRGGRFTALVTLNRDGRWHLSVAHAFRIPTWEELGAARDALLPPDVWLCVPHPPREHWANFHANTLHLVEVTDPGMIAQWRAEGENARARGASAPSGPRQGGGPL